MMIFGEVRTGRMNRSARCAAPEVVSLPYCSMVVLPYGKTHLFARRRDRGGAANDGLAPPETAEHGRPRGDCPLRFAGGLHQPGGARTDPQNNRRDQEVASNRLA